MRNGSGRAWRGLVRAGVRAGRAMAPLGWAGVLLGALAAAGSATAQVRHQGAALDGSGGVVALASGDGHSCAIRADGTVACWGANYAGQSTPPEGRFIAVAAGMMHSCGLRDDGRLECWGGIVLPPQDEWKRYVSISTNGGYVCAIGNDGRGECLGWTPFALSSNERLTALATSDDHACALLGNGFARCWGNEDRYGELSPPPERYTAIAAGYGRSCGLRADGTVGCWGQPLEGTPVPAQARFTALSMGRHHACGLAVDGAISCWGDSPPPPPGRYVAVSSGAYHACGLRSDGAVACWGDNFEGATQPPPGVFGLGSLDAGLQHACQVRADGVASCWGRNDHGQVQAPQSPWWEPRRFTQVAASALNTCGRRDDGQLECWGNNDDGQGLPPGQPLHAPTMGYAHGCALAVDGTAQCWGWDVNGQASPPLEPLRNLSAGFVHTCGVRDDGTAQCWGYDGNGQLTPPPAPYGQEDAHIASLRAHDWGACVLFTSNDATCNGLYYGGGAETLQDVRAYATGASHVCWIDMDGALHCAGDSPVVHAAVPEGRFVSVTSAAGFACAIRSDGARVCWGDNTAGEFPRLQIEPHELPILGTVDAVDLPLRLERWTSGGPDHDHVPGTFALLAGQLPPGLTLSVEGRIQGTATQGGRYSFTVEARDEDGFVASRLLHLQVDATPPEVTALVEGPRGDNDWYVGPVRISWTVADADSWAWEETGCGESALESDSPGAGFTCTARSAGGTTSQSVSVKLDATAPETGIGEGPAAISQETTATFDFGGGDVLSGVARFECSLDDVPFAACSSRLTLTGLAPGAHVFAVRAVDRAGNVDATPALHHWRVDTTAPVVTPTVEGEMGANGWYVGDVHISWTVQDPESPLDALTGCEALTLDSDTPGASFTCTATSAGGTSSQTVHVKRDATAPVVVASALAPANAAGWYRGDVAVGFSCSDALSGVACPATQSITGEGSALSSTAVTVSDAAGNRATSNVVTVRIDRTAPTLAPMAPASVLLNATASASANGSDALSGVAAQACTALVTASVGQRTTTCTVTDQAGNSASAGTGYRVVYGFNGFTAPVQNAPVLNVLKAGRSVPLRWRVLDANGAPVSNLSSASVAAVSIGCPAASENRITVYGGSNASLQNLGNGYYQMDWQSTSALRNLCRRLELDLGDGQPRSVQFKFN